MKQCVLIIACTLFLIQNLVAQDKIIMKDKEELDVKIVEQTDKLIKYKLPDYEDGPIVSIKNNQIEKIEYKNGIVDRLGNENPRHYKPFGVSAGMCYFLTDEAGYILVNMDYFIIPQIDLQVSFGNDGEGSYFSLGSKFHLNTNYSKKKITPYTGLYWGIEYGARFVQIPLGVNYICKYGLNISLSVNELIYLDSAWQSTFAELTLGWRFKI